MEFGHVNYFAPCNVLDNIHYIVATDLIIDPAKGSVVFVPDGLAHLDPVPELRHPPHPEILLDLDGLPALVNHLVHIERGVSLKRENE